MRRRGRLDRLVAGAQGADVGHQTPDLIVLQPSGPGGHAVGPSLRDAREDLHVAVAVNPQRASQEWPYAASGVAGEAAGAGPPDERLAAGHDGRPVTDVWIAERAEHLFVIAPG